MNVFYEKNLASPSLFYAVMKITFLILAKIEKFIVQAIVDEEALRMRMPPDGPERGSYSHFPVKRFFKSPPTIHVFVAQIYIQFPFSYYFCGNESQSQCMISKANSYSNFTPAVPLQVSLSYLEPGDLGLAVRLCLS